MPEVVPGGGEEGERRRLTEVRTRASGETVEGPVILMQEEGVPRPREQGELN